MSRRALLINPPVYDLQYWPEWSQPHGLLKVGAYLRQQGYETRLIDCLYPDERGRVRKRTKSVVEYCSTTELPYGELRRLGKRLGPNQRLKFVFGTHPDDLRCELAALSGIKETPPDSSGSVWRQRPLPHITFVPDEIWITSIMTYWWESTVDVAVLCKELFPSAQIRIGGIYPTLAPEHIARKLRDRGLPLSTVLGCDFDLDDSRDVIVVGEIPGASWLDLDLDLYYEPAVPNSRYYHGPEEGDAEYSTAISDRRHYGPSYAILTTTRGCPFDCAYCAQRAYNLYDSDRVRSILWTDEDGQRIAVRTRGSDVVVAEIRDKFHNYGIREFAFYEDNFLVRRDHFRAVLQGIVDDPDLRGNLHLHAPEGIEVRLIDDSLARLMRTAGFERVYLPLESINSDVTRSWNRSHSNVGMFQEAVQNCIEAGFRLGNMQINAFVLFGTPGEDIRNVVDSVIFASSYTGSVIPMLFTPVPGSALYEEYEGYLADEMGFDLQHLNGKLLPFLRLNQARHPELRARDYLDLEAFMFRVNAHAARGVFDIAGDSQISRAFRKGVIGSCSTS
jgi:radical SAM superfamily enzyme YgiQ (UPF0313 family)